MDDFETQLRCTEDASQDKKTLGDCDIRIHPLSATFLPPRGEE